MYIDCSIGFTIVHMVAFVNFILKKMMNEWMNEWMNREEIMTLAFFVLAQYRLVTDRQTDRHVAVAKTRASIASHG